MSDDRHTPAEAWEAQPDTHGGHYLVVDENGFVVARVVDEDDARLMAKAPRMEALLVKLYVLAREKPGRTEEELWNDMEDAYGNGLEVGRHEALQEVRRIVTPLVSRGDRRGRRAIVTRKREARAESTKEEQ